MNTAMQSTVDAFKHRLGDGVKLMSGDEDRAVHMACACGYVDVQQRGSTIVCPGGLGLDGDCRRRTEHVSEPDRAVDGGLPSVLWVPGGSGYAHSTHVKMNHSAPLIVRSGASPRRRTTTTPARADPFHRMCSLPSAFGAPRTACAAHSTPLRAPPSGCAPRDL
jgi:hypothetical protein